MCIPPDNRVLFFLRDRAEFGFLSHFYPSVIVLDGDAWPSAEHYYQAQKSDEPSYKAAVRTAPRAYMAKQLGAPPDGSKRVSARSWFRAHGLAPRPDWDALKLDAMRRADRAKYAQNADLRERLLATRDAEIVEDIAKDPFWGTGPDGRGANWAGRILMDVRADLMAGGG